MKRITTSLLIAILLFALVGCQSENPQNTQSPCDGEEQIPAFTETHNPMLFIGCTDDPSEEFPFLVHYELNLDLECNECCSQIESKMMKYRGESTLAKLGKDIFLVSGFMFETDFCGNPFNVSDTYYFDCNLDEDVPEHRRIAVGDSLQLTWSVEFEFVEGCEVPENISGEIIHVVMAEDMADCCE